MTGLLLNFDLSRCEDLQIGLGGGGGQVEFGGLPALVAQEPSLDVTVGGDIAQQQSRRDRSSRGRPRSIA